MEDEIVTEEQNVNDQGREAEAEWRHRALSAESRLEQAEEELGAARRAVDVAERRREAERLLLEHGALDLETALMLTEATIAQMDEPDVTSAVEELRRRKAFLFTTPSRASAMSGHTEPDDDPLTAAAEQARASGDRRVLLRYLRLKRSRG